MPVTVHLDRLPKGDYGEAARFIHRQGGRTIREAVDVLLTRELVFDNAAVALAFLDLIIKLGGYGAITSPVISIPNKCEMCGASGGTALYRGLRVCANCVVADHIPPAPKPEPVPTLSPLARILLGDDEF